MRIVCLANSFRVGGRCLGGIALDQNNNPLFHNGRPKWIRPVCNTEHEEVPTEVASNISLLDVVEFQEAGATRHGHQTENVLFTDSITKVGRFPYEALEPLTDNNKFDLVFGNRGAAVPEHLIGNFNYSLTFLSLTEFETNERVFEDRYYPQIKLSFRFNGHLYNFPVTDPAFLHKYQNNSSILQDKNQVYVTFSLAVPHDSWASKLVAGIIYNSSVIANTNNVVL